MSGGKGSTDIQAKVSGLCEALERYSAIYCGDEHAVRGTYESLAPARDPPQRLHGLQRRAVPRPRGAGTPSPPSRCVMVPGAVRSEDARSTGRRVWSLTHERGAAAADRVLLLRPPRVPTGRLVHPRLERLRGGQHARGGDPARLHGAGGARRVALWWYNRVRRRGRGPGQLRSDPYLRAMREALRRHWAASSGCSTSRATSASRPSPASPRAPTGRPRTCWSASAPTSIRDRAAARHHRGQPVPALGLPHAARRLDALPVRRRPGPALVDHGPARGHGLSPPGLRPGPRRAADFDDPSTDDLAEDVQLCVESRGEHGLEVLVLDQTRPDIGLSVARVVVPGLCHFWRRLGFRRLYEVPVAMGGTTGRFDPTAQSRIRSSSRRLPECSPTPAQAFLHRQRGRWCDGVPP